jgi:hypothetical protein
MLIEVRTLDKNSNPLKVTKGDTLPIQHTVEPNTRVEIYMDGQKQNGQSAAGAPSKKLTKVGKNLVLSEEDKPLVELVNFYGEAGVTLVGDNWSAEDTQLTAVPEGLAFQEAAPQQVGALVAAGPSTLTWVLGGVAAVGLGGGGGGGGSTTTTTSTTPSASTTIAAALAVIKDYSGSNTVPTLSHYKAAGVTGVTDGNLSAINSAISPLVSGVTDTTVKVQAVVDAYKAVLAAADQTDNNATNLTQAQYVTLGVEGVDTPEAKNLLGDVIDIKSNSDVDTIKKLQDLADEVAAVMKTAKGDTSAPVTQTQLAALGITKVTADNIGVIQALIERTKDDGSEVDTLGELQGIVDKLIEGMGVIKVYDTDGKTTVPTLSHYKAAGVTGVSDGSEGGNNNLGAVNSAIALLSEDVTNTTAKVQAVVDAYKAVLAAADGTGNNATKPSQAQYATLGVKGVDTTEAKNLLGDVIDTKSNDDVNTVDQLQSLANQVAAVMKTAKGDTSASVTEAQLTAWGITQVNADNIKAIQAAIEITKDDGSEVDTLSELQGIVNTIVASKVKIQTYGTGTPLADVPTRIDYSNIGVTGVTDGTNGNLNAINSSIDYLGESDTNTSAKVQNVVDAYKAIFDNANGKDNSKDTTPAFTPPTAKQYADIGISFSGLKDEQVKARVALLGSAIDVKSMGGVDTLDKVKNLADTVDKLMKHAADTSQTFTLNELTNLGITGLTAKNMVGMLTKLFESDNGGTGIDTLRELQDMVDTKAPVFKTTSNKYTVDTNGRFVAHMSENDSTFVMPILTDADANNKYTFTLSTDDGKWFKFTDYSEVVFRTTPDWEYPDDGEKNNSYHFEVTAEDSAGNITKQLYSVFVDNVTDDFDIRSADGQYLGKLIAAKAVEGKLYYFWDKNGNGVADIDDATTMDNLATIFKYNSDGVLNKNNGGYITEEFRFATLSGYKVALPTTGRPSDWDFNLNKGIGTDFDLLGANSPNKVASSKYNDLMAIWDAYNGSSTGTGLKSNPPGWMSGLYWNAEAKTLMQEGDSHGLIDFTDGSLTSARNLFGDKTQSGFSERIYAVFEVL